MANKQTAFRLTDTALEYLENYADENNLNRTESLEKIIREHKEQSKETLSVIADEVVNRIDDEYKNLFTRLRLSSNFTDRNVQIILEILNTLMVNLDIKHAFPTHSAKSAPFERCENVVKERISNFKQHRDDKAVKSDAE